MRLFCHLLRDGACGCGGDDDRCSGQLGGNSTRLREEKKTGDITHNPFPRRKYHDTATDGDKVERRLGDS